MHFHECFDPAAFLRAAAENLREAARRRDLATADVALFFTESRGACFFRSLRDGARTVPGWRLRRTGEAESLVLDGTGSAGDAGTSETLILIAGRQIVTRERLEVLALGTDEDLADGDGLAATIERVLAAGALPCVPWGFGKWSGARGRAVREAVRSAAPGRLFLGDNGGRTRAVGYPAILAEAARQGVSVLAGSDPLPFPGHASRAGSYGFVLPVPAGDDAPDPDRPAAALKAALRELRRSPSVFGRLESLPRFCRYQVAMQLRRFRKG